MFPREMHLLELSREMTVNIKLSALPGHPTSHHLLKHVHKYLGLSLICLSAWQSDRLSKCSSRTWNLTIFSCIILMDEQ